MEIELGKMNRMTVVKEVDFGLYLDGGEMGEILLPARYVPVDTRPGDELTVFVYLDSEERLVATTQTPLAQVGEFACLEVAWVNQYGAFLNWGLMKDLFVPFGEQKQKMVQGGRYIVHVHLDDESFRIVASAKVEHYLTKEKPDYRAGDEVNILVWQKTNLGFKAIIDNRYGGLLYADEIFRPLHTGDRTRAYIKQVRDDGKVDLALQPAGARKSADFAEELLEHLRANGGHTPLHDKSDAEEIYRTFGVSKKTFKKGVGDLYKRRLITLQEDGITLAK
ncbi:MAG: GntR family transcriptional regulator [Prevotellaceae bacterium]|jgi:predicted RNA-binding protein (virulence factor B family)|nr:GntR family transcriptional regulator [Prevotellaceae bacterium]